MKRDPRGPTATLRDDLAAELRSRADAQYKEAADGIGHFRCQRHEDSKPSAWLRDSAWGCFACGEKETEPLKTLAEVLGVPVPPPRGFTVEEYASLKGFDAARLHRWGLRTITGLYGNDVVEIPYRDADGAVLRAKHRASAGKRPFWDPNTKGAGTFLYGLDVLGKQKDTARVILCEGESDCHAAWHHNVLAVGVSGAEGWKREWAPLFARRTVYVWQEPGDAGAKFVRKIARDLPKARVIVAPTRIKDLAELHRHHTADEFTDTLVACQTAAPFARDIVSAATSSPSSEPAPTSTSSSPLASIVAPSVNPTVAAPGRVSFTQVDTMELDRLYAQRLLPVDAVPTGFSRWNALCGGDGGRVGIARGWDVRLAGATGRGKTLVALNLTASAITHGERVGYLTLEMSKDELESRLMAILSGVPIVQLEKGAEFQTGAFRHAQKFFDDLRTRTGGNLYVNSEYPRDLDEVLVAIHDLHRLGVRFIVLDYMQRVRVRGQREFNLFAQITQTSVAVTECAKELGIVFIGLSQFNRATSKDRQAPPVHEGMMGGSSLENDADQVLLIDHSAYERDFAHNVASANLLLTKNRHGPTATIPVIFDYSNLRVRLRAPMEDAASAIAVRKGAPQTAATNGEHGMIPAIMPSASDGGQTTRRILK